MKSDPDPTVDLLNDASAYGMVVKGLARVGVGRAGSGERVGGESGESEVECGG